jgi:hypothetical protein
MSGISGQRDFAYGSILGSNLDHLVDTTIRRIDYSGTLSLRNVITMSGIKELRWS